MSGRKLTVEEANVILDYGVRLGNLRAVAIGEEKTIVNVSKGVRVERVKGCETWEEALTTLVGEERDWFAVLAAAQYPSE